MAGSIATHLEGSARKVQDSGAVVLAEIVVDIHAEKHAPLDAGGQLERIKGGRRRVLRYQVGRDRAARKSSAEKALR